MAGSKLVVWTFDSLPKGGLLTDNAEKCALFRDNGVDFVIFEDFAALHDLDGRAFFTDVIAARYKPGAVVCGYNFRFGRGASCTADDLRRYAEESGITCAVVPNFQLDGTPVSSTAIRSLIRSGDVKAAANMLGRYYSVTLPIVHGHEIGRTIGHPTVNQIIPKGRVTPSRGVYSCLVEFTDKRGVHQIKKGVCNIGVRPTVNSDTSDVTLETYIFDYSGDLYGVTIRTRFCEKLRDERRFSSKDELSAQIARDSENALKSLIDIEKNDLYKNN